MNETYKEIMIKRKLTFGGIALRIAVVFATIYAAFFGLLFEPLFLFLALGLGFVTWYVFRVTALEFEYLLLGKEIIIDKIMGRSKRKRAEVVDIGKMELLAVSTSHSLDSYKNQKNRKVTDYSAKYEVEDMKHYTMVYGNDRLIYLHLPEDAVSLIKGFSPRKVMLD